MRLFPKLVNQWITSATEFTNISQAVLSFGSTSCSFFWFTLLSMLDLLSPEVHLVMGEGAASTPIWLYMSVAADEISKGRLNKKAKLVTSSCSFGKISVLCVGNASETGEPSVSFSVLLTLETPI